MARLPYMNRESLAEADKPLWDELAGERGRLPLVTQILMYHPSLAAMAEHINRAVRFDLSIPRSAVELVILTVSRETNCVREWGIHLPQARNAGVREEAIESVRDKVTPKGLTDDEAEVVAYAQEILRTNRVSDKTFEAVKRRYGEVGVVDLTALVGVYSMLAAVMNAFEVEAPEDPALQLPM